MILKRLEPQLILHAIFLSAVSLVLLASVASPDVQTRQLISISLGVGVYVVSALLGRRFWEGFSPWFYLGACVMLLGVLIAGDSAGGATRWFSLAGARFQPSEFTKVALVLALASFSKTLPRSFNGFNLISLIPPGAIIVLPTVMILLQPDLGTAGCHVLVGVTILMVLGIRSRTYAFLLIAGLASLWPMWDSLHEYQQDRIVNFMSPELDPLGDGYHQRQSLIAVGSGKVFGKGFGEGTQTQLRFLPEQNTDFIFSVLAEEWGFFGSFVLMFCYCSFIYFLIFGAKKGDTFSKVLRVGTAALLFWQVVINVGMATGVAPVVGLTLPLVSYGGSSLVSIMLLLGICASCNKK